MSERQKVISDKLEVKSELLLRAVQERVKWRAWKGSLSHGSGAVWVKGNNGPSVQVDEAIGLLTRAGILSIGSEFSLDADGWTSSGKITSKNAVEEKLCLKTK